MTSSNRDQPATAEALRAQALVRYGNVERMRRTGVTSATFRQIYGGQPPWEIGRPQPFVVEWERAGGFRGTVLDVGCGRGENAFFLASRGHEVWAIDFVAEVVAEAENEMARRGLSIVFRAMDAMDLASIGQMFDTVLDSATFHTFTREQRLRYARVLRDITSPGARLHLICLGDVETRPGGPPRVTRDDIRESFAEGWEIVDICERLYVATNFPGGARAWAAEIVRT